MLFNTLNSELNPICHLLALLGAHPILNISRIRVNMLMMFVFFTAHQYYLKRLLFQVMHTIINVTKCLFPMPAHVLSDFVVSLRLWLKCNRLLRLGRPVGAVTLSRWEWWWNEGWIWGARGGGLKPNFCQLPRPLSPWASSPFKEKRIW